MNSALTIDSFKPVVRARDWVIHAAATERICGPYERSQGSLLDP